MLSSTQVHHPVVVENPVTLGEGVTSQGFHQAVYLHISGPKEAWMSLELDDVSYEMNDDQIWVKLALKNRDNNTFQVVSFDAQQIVDKLNQDKNYFSNFTFSLHTMEHMGSCGTNQEEVHKEVITHEQALQLVSSMVRIEKF